MTDKLPSRLTLHPQSLFERSLSLSLFLTLSSVSHRTVTRTTSRNECDVVIVHISGSADLTPTLICVLFHWNDLILQV